jgi:hypothetical protein
MTMPFTKPFIFKKTAKNLFSVNELQIHDITVTNQQASSVVPHLIPVSDFGGVTIRLDMLQTK